nr:hypothetical protein BaRGS_018376 [Batillaria attramentaria]
MSRKTTAIPASQYWCVTASMVVNKMKTVPCDLGHLHEVWIEPGSLQPTCRRDHSAVVHNNNMYVYGGFVDSAGSSQEFWAYSIDTTMWQKLQTSGPAILPALCYHASVSCDQSHYTEGQSVHTQSTPHLKPAAKYQLQADQRFVVLPAF